MFDYNIYIEQEKLAKKHILYYDELKVGGWGKT